MFKLYNIFSIFGRINWLKRIFCIAKLDRNCDSFIRLKSRAAESEHKNATLTPTSTPTPGILNITTPTLTPGILNSRLQLWLRLRLMWLSTFGHPNEVLFNWKHVFFDQYAHSYVNFDSESVNYENWNLTLYNFSDSDSDSRDPKFYDSDSDSPALWISIGFQ